MSDPASDSDFEGPNSADDLSDISFEDHHDDQSKHPDWAKTLPAFYLAERPDAEQAQNEHVLSVYGQNQVLTAAPDGLGPRIRLLRIQPNADPDAPIVCKLIVRPIFDPPPYIALSYSWGSTSSWSTKDDIVIDGTSFPVSSHLWHALHRLRDPEAVVNVWVDAICINQQNLLDKAAQVRIMAQIYDAAEEVDIWLGTMMEDYDADNDHDFFSRLRQDSSPWWRRLWVVQECAYARKCPVVLLGRPSSMSLEELVQCWTASVLAHEPSTLLQQELEFLRVPLEIWKDNRRAPLLQRLRETMGRQASSPHDRIYAILSLVDESEQIIPDYRKSYTRLAAEVKRLLRHQRGWRERRDKPILDAVFLVEGAAAGLEEATRQGNVAKVQKLLHNNPVPASMVWDLLEIASSKGHVLVVETLVNALLEADCDIGAARSQARFDKNLREASIENQVEVVRMLLRLPHADWAADIDMRGNGYYAALNLASARGDREVMRLLLDAGGEDKVQKTVRTSGQVKVYLDSALDAASRNGHVDVVKMLLYSGTNSDDWADVKHGRALLHASRMGHEEVATLLLDGGADVHVQGGEYGNALQAASFHGHPGMVRLLLGRGAAVNAKGGQSGESNPLYAASENGHTLVVKSLLEAGADVNARVGARYGNALQAASWRGHDKVVWALLYAGADVHAKGGEHGHALQAASRWGHREVVILLLAAGANANAEGGMYGGSNALSVASLENHKGVVKTLVKAGADINNLYDHPLQYNSKAGNVEMVKVLVEAGADVNGEGGPFGNALHTASMHGRLEVATLLLDAGADIDALWQGISALEAALSSNNMGVAHLLMDRDARSDTADRWGGLLQAASRNNHIEVVRQLISRGANVNLQGGQWGNALQAASRAGNDHVARLLIHAGADVNAEGGMYHTALQAASHWGHAKVVRLLLIKGADIAAHGGDALRAASWSGHRHIVQILTDEGARENDT